MLWTGRQPEPRDRIKGQIKEHGLELPEQAAVQQGAVQVAGQQHPLTRLSEGQQTGLEQPTGAIDAIPAALGPEQLGDGRLALGHGPLGFQRPADLGQLRQIPAPRDLAQQLRQGRRQGTSSAVGGEMQRQTRPAPLKQLLEQHHS